MVIRNSPSEHGEVPDGDCRRPAFQRRRVSEQSQGHAGLHRPARPLRTPAFWLISLGHGFALLVVHAVAVHAITHLKEDLGYSIAHASLVISLVTISQMAGVGLGWLIGDRWEKRYIAAACMLAHAVGLLLLTYAVSLPMVVAFAVLHGAAWGLRGPFMQAIRADYFGRSAIGMILGLSFMIIVIGQVGGPIVPGSRRHHRELPHGIHHPRGAGRTRLDVLRAGEETEAARSRKTQGAPLRCSVAAARRAAWPDRRTRCAA
jgi:sugar phosphate permease